MSLMFNLFYQKFGKRMMDIILSILGLIFLWPIFLFLAVLIKFDSPGPIIFKQKRVGKDGKIFTLYKFRTMIENAERLKEKYHHLNEADGPVFKIKNDPRFTHFGKILSHTGLDELLQLWNVLRGEISLVGPRPLPVNEEAKIPQKWQLLRRKDKPGLSSSWLINGAHGLSFNQWMNFDLEDIEKSNFGHDSRILLLTVLLGVGLIKERFLHKSGH